MGEIVNLRRGRKARDRAAAKHEAAANRARHGRTLTEKKADRVARERLDRTLDGARREE